MYNFTNKEEQIAVLKEYLDGCGKWQEEYVTEGDGLQDYADMAGNDLRYDDIDKHYCSEILEICAPYLEHGVIKSEIKQVLKDIAEARITGIYLGSNEICGIGIGELEVQVSGNPGTVNGVDVNCVFEALKEGLDDSEIDTDYYLSRDCIYVNMDYDRVVLAIDTEVLASTLADKFPRFEFNEDSESIEEIQA